MSCGLKKQQNNEGGVHLTERTCSPYNPIIKLIVDDCLGLPIYPVSSIDAVIDEDGNTLRKLLENLLDKINSQSGDITDDLEAIRTILEGLDDLYAPNSIQKLVWAISAMTNEQTVTSETPRYDGQTTVPKIVKAVIDLQDLMELILQGGGSLADLQEQIDSLSLIVNRISECDVTLSPQGARLPEIIQKIKEILLELEILQDNAVVTPNLNGTLRQKVAWLKSQLAGVVSRLESLEEQVGTLPDNAAHLDEQLLTLRPNGFSGNEEIFLTLKPGEYPPDSVDILASETIGNRRNNVERLEYYGFFKPIPIDQADANTAIYDLYPFCHTDQTMGLPLYYLPKTGDDGYTALIANGQLLRIGNGTVGPKDLDVLMKIIANGYSYPPTLSSNVINNIGGLYAQLGEDAYIKVGYINADPEITVGDVNEMVSFLINRNTNLTPSLNQENMDLLPTHHYELDEFHWLAYYVANSVSPTCYYPCVEGKMYTDTFTGDIYKYSKGKMYKISNNVDIDVLGLLMDTKSEYRDEDNSVGLYKKVTISNPRTCYYCETYEEVNALNNGDLFVIDKPSSYIAMGLSTSKNTCDTVDTNGENYTYKIDAVTNSINYLLDGGATKVLKDSSNENALALQGIVEGLEDILDNLDTSTQIGLNIYNAIDGIIHNNDTASFFLEVLAFLGGDPVDSSFLNSVSNIQLFSLHCIWGELNETSRPDTPADPPAADPTISSVIKDNKYLWYKDKDGTLNYTTVPAKIVGLHLGEIQDVDGDSKFTLGDVTFIINKLLSNPEVIEKDISLYPVVYMKTKNINSLDNLDDETDDWKGKNPRFGIEGTTLYDFVNDRMLCVISPRGEVRSIEDLVTFNYNQSSEELQIYRNNVIVASINLGDIVREIIGDTSTNS